MPEIVFKGKEYVYNHHLTVPYRPLVPHADKGIGPADLAGNLVVHGDNLQALKSLLPRYAGAVDLIFIDPPYNTGNEGWCYSDNVNSPIMKEWLSTNPVDGEDLLRARCAHAPQAQPEVVGLGRQALGQCRRGEPGQIGRAHV